MLDVFGDTSQHRRRTNPDTRDRGFEAFSAGFKESGESIQVMVDIEWCVSSFQSFVKSVVEGSSITVSISCFHRGSQCPH